MDNDALFAACRTPAQFKTELDRSDLTEMELLKLQSEMDKDLETLRLVYQDLGLDQKVSDSEFKVLMLSKAAAELTPKYQAARLMRDEHRHIYMQYYVENVGVCLGIVGMLCTAAYLYV